MQKMNKCSSFTPFPLTPLEEGAAMTLPHQRNARPCSVPRSDGKSYPDRIIINKGGKKVKYNLLFFLKKKAFFPGIEALVLLQNRAERTRSPGGECVKAARHNLLFYTLEETPRPGAHEIRVRPAPDGMRIRSRREQAHAE